MIDHLGKHILLFFIILSSACTELERTNAPLTVPQVHLSSTSEDAWFSPMVIYGEDDRKDLHQIQDPEVLHLAQGTVGLIRVQNLRAQPMGQLLTGTTFGESYNLCEDEPFREQITAAHCSGSLIAEDLILTAGHCVRNKSACDETAIVFGYSLPEASIRTPFLIPDQDVYFCKQIVHTEMPPRGADFALIRLDRKVEGRTPLQIRRAGKVSEGQKLLVIGHPAGLPTKVADGGSLRKIHPNHFEVDLDTYGGNSGSPVFNQDSGVIEGILVRGEVDFVQRGPCKVSHRCAQKGCSGEEVTPVSKVLPRLPDAWQ